MAGKERSGFSASDPSIFVGASYLITPCGAPEWAVEEVSSLAKGMGFGRVVPVSYTHLEQIKVVELGGFLSGALQRHRFFTAQFFFSFCR